MSLQIVLECRLDACEHRDRFDNTDQIADSDWTEASPLGVVEHGGVVHAAFCPGHSM
jgi:hypothetical protein